MPKINVGNLENQEKILELIQMLYTSSFTPTGFDWGTFFGLRQTGELFSTKFYSTTDSGEGVFLNDSIDHVCEPSTDKIKGRDDFEHHNAFWYTLCNFTVDDSGKKIPTALKGQSDFKLTGEVDVGVLTPPLYWGEETDAEGFTKHFSDSEHPTKRPDLTLTLMPHCRDNKMNPMPYGIVPVYYFGKIGDKLYGSSGLPIENFMSYNKLHTEMQKKGTGWQGAGSERSAYLKNFLWIKYKTLNSQKIFPGCTSYSFQYKVTQAESNKRYVVISKSNAANIVVGNTVSIGNSANETAPDRNTVNSRDIASLVKVTKVEDIDSDNSRVYVDVDADFTTTTNTFISSMPLHSGQTDTILGNDGQIKKDSKHSFRIQGVEDGVGAYMVSSNEVMNKDNATQTTFYYKDNADYIATGFENSWKKLGQYTNEGSKDIWIGEEKFDLKTGASMIRKTSTGNAKGTGDIYYWGGTSTGPREHLSRGGLGDGLGAGLSFLNGGGELGRAVWDFSGCAS